MSLRNNWDRFCDVSQLRIAATSLRLATLLMILTHRLFRIGLLKLPGARALMRAAGMFRRLGWRIVRSRRSSAA